MEEYVRAILTLLGRIDERQANRRMRLLSAFLEGVMRGLGTTIGFAVVGTILIYLLQSIARANLPLISDFLAEVITLVQLRMK